MRKVAIVAVGMLLVLSLPAYADWVPGMPYKWLQMPDLTTDGLDVNATFAGPGVFPFVKVLADDFQCTQPGPITDVHVWGSWLNNNVYADTTFKLSIHADVPAGVDAPYSHPGPVLWDWIFTPGQYLQRPWAAASERFYDPNTNQIIGTDTEVFQYNFYIPEAQAFHQTGTTQLPMTYWLDVQALTPDPSFVFGWKTSQQHWNDDAVYGDTAIFGGPVIGPMQPPVFWNHLLYPDGQFVGQSIDLAFVITPEPASLSLLVLGGLALLRRRR